MAGDFSIEFHMKGKLPTFHTQSILGMVGEGARQEWVKLASTTFHSTAKVYLSALGGPVLGKNQVSVTLEADSDNGIFANRLEQGCGPFDMKCIADGRHKVYTSKGYIDIKNVKIGDLVLTCSGEMNRVLATHREKLNRGDIIYRIRTKKSGWISVTGNHPILTNTGWVRADELNPNIHKIKVLAIVCKTCGKKIEYKRHHHKLFNPDEHQFCNKSCASKFNNEFRRLNGRTDLSEEMRKRIGKKATETNHRLYSEGKHASQPGNKLNLMSKGNPLWGVGDKSDEEISNMRHKAAVTLGRHNFFSDPESVFWEHLKQLDGFERQVMVKRNCFKSFREKQVNRWYFLDFANKNLKIAVEINGDRFHTEKEIEIRTNELENYGWKVLNFRPKEIYKNPDNCIQEVKQLLYNHTNQFIFTDSCFEIEKKKVGRFSGYERYNLTIEKNRSFVVSTIVVHNSGFLKSPKVKQGSTGPYITIPLKLKTSGSIGGSPPVMPSVISRQATKLKMGESMQLSKKYEGYGLRTRLSADLKRWGHYTWQTSPFQGITKVARWPNLIPLGLPREASAAYMTFRRVSSKSDPNSWIHPGFQGKKLAEQVANKLDGIVSKIIDSIAG